MPKVPQDLLDDHSSDEEEVDFQYEIHTYACTVQYIIHAAHLLSQFVHTCYISF